MIQAKVYDRLVIQSLPYHYLEACDELHSIVVWEQEQWHSGGGA